MQTTPLQSLVGDFLRRELHIGKHRDVVLLASVVFCSISLFIATIARLHPITHDAFHEMAMIRYWHQAGVFPVRDVFAFTPTVSPAVHHEWGTGVLLYLATLAFSENLVGIAVLKWTMIVLFFSLLYRHARMTGCHPLLLALLAPVVFPMLWVGFSTVRAGLFTLVAIAAQMCMQQQDLRKGRAWILGWSMMYLVWLNVHAGFVVGIAMLALHGLERLLLIIFEEHPKPLSTSWMAWLVACPSTALTRRVGRDLWHLFLLVPVVGLGLYCNPWSSDYLPYLIRAIAMPRPTMLEWQPLWHTVHPELTLLAFVTSLGLLAYGLAHRRWSRWAGCLICLFAAYMALKHIRHGAIYGTLWIGFVPSWLSPTPLGRQCVRWGMQARQFFLRGAFLLTIVAMVFSLYHRAFSITVPSSLQDSPHCYPVAAVDFLEKEKRVGNILVPFHAGSYVSWRLFPAMRVSVDGRYEVAYQEEVLPNHNVFYRAEPGWKNVIERYRPDYLLVPSQSPVMHALQQSDSQWRILYQDTSYCLFEPVSNLDRGRPLTMRSSSHGIQ